MNQAEASGKTVDDALKRALSQLGARAEDVEITVLDEGKRGFFGRGGRDALVRVERRGGATPEAAPVETPAARSSHKPASKPSSGDTPRPRRSSNRRREDHGRQSLETAVPKLTADDFLLPGQKPQQSDSRSSSHDRRDHGGRSRGGARESQDSHDRQQGGRSSRQSASRPSQRPRHRDDEPRIEPDINAEEVDFAAGIVDDLLRIVDIHAEISIREPVTPGDGLGNVLAVIDIMGEDLGLLIGRRGETLLSLQYLVNLIVGKHYPGRGGVTVDVEHYRHRREEQVIALAQRMADRVKETGAPITLEPMTPAERRLVHITFAEDPEIVTNSVGEGEHRKVVIGLRERG